MPMRRRSDNLTRARCFSGSAKRRVFDATRKRSRSSGVARFARSQAVLSPGFL